jgi:multidrug resistance efflux pump
MGLTEAYQYRVQFENAVVIEEILVQSGQEVKKGDLILKLSSSKLTHELATVNMELYQNFSEYRLYNSKANDFDEVVKLIKDKKEKTILELKILSLVDIKSIFEKQIADLKVKAPFDGYIGNLNFVLGETVPGFNPVANVSEKKAKIVRSYVLEDDPSAAELTVGLDVNIRSGNGVNVGDGKIFQIGTEVKELPTRFQKTGYDTAYGREILVKITDEAMFITGERVVVEIEK